MLQQWCHSISYIGDTQMAKNLQSQEKRNYFVYSEDIKIFAKTSNLFTSNKNIMLLNTPIAPLQSGKTRPPTNECLGYNTKQSNGEVPVMLELWGIQSTPSLPLLLRPLWPGIAPDRALSMGQIDLNCLLMLKWIVWIKTIWLNWIAWNKNVFDN